jgi:YHS domain-containing protein
MRAWKGSLAVLLFVAFNAFGEESNGSCAYGLSALGIDVKTDCSVRWADPATGKLYCFGNEEVLAKFLKDPAENVRKAEQVYAKFNSK